MRIALVARSSALLLLLASLGCQGDEVPPGGPIAAETAKAAPESVAVPPAAAPAASAAPTETAPVAASAPPAEPAAPAPAALSARATNGVAPAPLASAAAAPSASAAAVASAAAAPAPEAPAVDSPKVAEAAFSVWLSSPGKLKVGQQASVQVVLVPKGDFHTNENYPYKMKLDAPPAGISYPSPVVRREALTRSPERASMAVPVVATAAGDQRISGTFSFSVCNAGQCVVDSRALAVNVTVEP